MKIAIAKYKQPILSTKLVYIGAYGGHYSAVVFFPEKPKKVKNNCLTLNNKTCGAMWLCDFQELYPNANISKLLDKNNNNQPFDIDVYKVIPIELEAFWDDYGCLVNYQFHADGY